MAFHIFPAWDKANSRLTDGMFLKAPPHCKRVDRSKCEAYYEDVAAHLGVHTCPHGYATYVADVRGERVIYSGLAISSHCDRNKLKKRQHDFMPKLPLEVVEQAVRNCGPLFKLEADHEELLGFVNATLHEIRKLNAQVKRQSEEVNIRAAKPDFDRERLQYRAGNILATSMLITTRLDFFDAQVNPDLLFATNPRPIGIYRKFAKARHCANTLAQGKRIQVNMVGECYSRCEAYDVFDLVPFVLIENAIKFSAENGRIDIEFSEDYDGLTVSVSSLGPQLEADEYEVVLQKGVRGRNATKTAEGSGLGLYFAKWVCDAHDILLTVRSEQDGGFVLNGVAHSLFYVDLHFPPGVLLETNRH